MHHNFNFKDVLAISLAPAGHRGCAAPGAQLDYGLPLPEKLARTAAAPFPHRRGGPILNQIRDHEYLALFGVVEEFVLPFVLDHAAAAQATMIASVPCQFAGEEAKHIHLFKQFHRLFTESFETECAVIGPPEAVAAEVLRHDPLAVAR